jgi:hypothetical protein
VLGPLIGADLVHLRAIEKIATGIANMGGAGTFDVHHIVGDRGSLSGVSRGVVMLVPASQSC